jgi:hypothetical protein
LRELNLPAAARRSEPRAYAQVARPRRGRHDRRPLERAIASRYAFSHPVLELSLDVIEGRLPASSPARGQLNGGLRVEAALGPQGQLDPARLEGGLVQGISRNEPPVASSDVVPDLFDDGREIGLWVKSPLRAANR